MSVLYWIQGIRSPFLDAIASVVTRLGEEYLFIVVAIVVFWCVSKKWGYYLLTVGFMGTLINQFLKMAFRIPRPWVLDPEYQIVESAREAATGYSFPSGHTQSAVGTFGGVARFAKKGWLRGVCIAAMVLVALSRLYLGVHTPLDVGVSFAIGIVLVLALYPIVESAEKKPGRLTAMLAAMFACSIALLAYLKFFPFPADVDVENLESGINNAWKLAGASGALVLTSIFDRKFVNFDTRAPWWGQIIKSVVGLAIVLGIQSGLKSPLIAVCGGAEGPASLIRYFIMVVFAAGIWPMSFRWFSGKSK